ncbi:hypothetical protein I4W93_019660 [Rheinheimera sp. MA13]|uniref:Uncharacterized protein n=2 Tax=Rheinheimera maricola TaxID=2793282 RepID=A0ABS7XE35_9GAMM|nr:hypothetical protein [Rheinheimera maricola]MBZ9613816.1 hypothetical protein [Rheinheimera maricola]
MHKALSLLIALTVTPAIANSYSNSEKRTLQAAVSSALHSAEITRYYQQCKEQPEDDSASVVITDKDQARLLALLQQKIHSQNITQLLAADPRTTQNATNKLIKPANCDDLKGIQALLDSYEVALFALDLALPLEKPLGQKIYTAKSRSNAEQNDIQQLIARSHAIALVSVVDKQQLTAVQQANYLHPDYTSRYVFKVQHGWRGNISQYLGMHIYVDDKNIDKTTKQWLIFLDKNGHFITTVPGYKAGDHMKKLQQAEWRYDVHGNLHRN